MDLSLCRVATIIVFLSSMLAPALAGAAPTAAEYGTILNLSGKQRMLSQRMSKEAVLIALRFNVVANQRNLKKTIDLFDRTLKGLSDGSPGLGLPATTSQPILQQLDKVAAIWAQFMPVMEGVAEAGRVSTEQVESIAAINLLLLREMDTCVGLYENAAASTGLRSDPDLAVKINLSGKQRMLSQKMSKEFFLIAYGCNSVGNMELLAKTIALFDRTIEGLIEGDRGLNLSATDNPAIRSQLKVVRAFWKQFKVKIRYATKGTEAIKPLHLNIIAGRNLPLLMQMDRVVGMYEKEAAR